MPDIDVLRTKLGEWARCLNGRDVHSVSMQIARMLWRSAFYRSVNESRRFLPDEGNGRKRGNEALHELLEQGYFTAGSTAVRQLLDSGSIFGLRGVWSLFGLTKDISHNLSLITRANVLGARGLEYDFEPIKQRAREEAWREARMNRSHGSFVSRDGWDQAEYWHRVMDRLSGTTAGTRRASDMADPIKFESLLSQLEQRGRNVRNWVNKYVAHAASPESRQTLGPDHQSLNLAKLWLAERVIVRSANFISYNFVGGTNIGGVPVPEFDQFLHLDQPFIESSALPAMRRAWADHCNEIGSCTNWSWDTPLADASDVWKDDENGSPAATRT